MNINRQEILNQLNRVEKRNRELSRCIRDYHPNSVDDNLNDQLADLYEIIRTLITAIPPTTTCNAYDLNRKV